MVHHQHLRVVLKLRDTCSWRQLQNQNNRRRHRLPEGAPLVEALPEELKIALIAEDFTAKKSASRIPAEL